ncbi:MAG TPA: DNA-formamidopyrimidine glycosylase [Bacillota bacterium]|jgi:formamidopyrimidine-DNA glycosylase|nr:DNA-formamidopyrimidine glycosylase [Bacillota bacterium]HOL08731.1 DNA-formamidopyrimidine glycosylase [Bacillota bacterium]HPO96366.1 DNA-formamidopyrimidine glycosylase [Bacillota bacterium]
MPELPEVETIRLSLAPKLENRVITGAEVLLPKLIQEITPKQFVKQITGKTIKGLKRRGKYLLIELTDESTITIHLRMTGQLTITPSIEEIAKATYLIIKLDNGSDLRFKDYRKFGKVFLFSNAQLPASLTKLGPEPLSDEFTIDTLKQNFKRRNIAIKKALLNQEIIAGIGNIYADEALFVAGIHPVRPVNSLTEDELNKLYHAIKLVLTEGIAYRGTTKKDYIDGEGNPGSYQDKLRVYGRKGLPCVKCNGPVLKMNFGGRGTHFCPVCQD